MVVVPLLLLLSMVLLPVRERKGLSLLVSPLLRALGLSWVCPRLGVGIVGEDRE